MTGMYGSAQRVPSLRFGRLGFGLVLLVVAAYTFYREAWLCRSSTAVMGAPLAALSAPIEGMLTLRTPLATGQLLMREVPLAVIDNTREDPSLLNITRQELEETMGRIRAFEQSLSRRGNWRPTALTPVAGIDPASSTELTELYARRVGLEARLEADTEAYERRSSAALVAPVTGRIWELRATHGAPTAKGETLMRIASCEHLLVFAQLNQRNFNRVSIGTKATFDLAGTGERYDATVIQKFGSAEMWSAEAPFAAPGLNIDRSSASETFIVVLASPGLVEARSKSCELGNTGSVRFDVALNPF